MDGEEGDGEGGGTWRELRVLVDVIEFGFGILGWCGLECVDYLWPGPAVIRGH